MTKLAVEKLELAKQILLQAFPDEIISLEPQQFKIEYKFQLQNHLVIYIQYNEFDEYSYLIRISSKSLDRILYDNFDDTWDVDSNPHHYHPRFSSQGEVSPMTGEPDNDIPLLVKEIQQLI